MTRVAAVMAAAVVVIAVGFAGAWAFHPDDGAVLHSEALWRVFGISVYLGALTFWLGAATLLVLAALAGWRRLRGG